MSFSPYVSSRYYLGLEYGLAKRGPKVSFDDSTVNSDYNPVVKQFLSDRGTVSADERTNTLIMRGIPKNSEEIRDLSR
jgi:type II secretory pathway component HofQ